MTTTKKITRTTLKSFIRKNAGNLFINVRGSFDGMTDCVQSNNNGFFKAASTDDSKDHTLGIDGLWLVGSSRDYFTAYEDENMIGIEYNNCCGYGIIAINK